MADSTQAEILPQQSVTLDTTARGQVMIKVTATAAELEEAERRAQAVFDRLRQHYKEVNEENSEFYRGK